MAGIASTAAPAQQAQVPFNPREHYDGSMEAFPRIRAIVHDDMRAKGEKIVDYDRDAVAKNEDKFKGHTPGAFNLTSEEMIMTVINTLKFQDPMNPEKPGDMTQMFAMASMTSTFADARVDIGAMKDMVARGISLKANNMSGQKIEAQHDIFKYDGKGSDKLGFDLPVKANQVEISILNDQHQTVRKMTVKDGDTIEIDGEKQKIDLKLGRNDIHWDGLKDNGDKADIGKYRFQVRPLDQKGNIINDPDTGKAFAIKKYVTGTMESSFVNEAGEQRILVDGIDMPLSAFTKSFGLNAHNAQGKTPKTEHPMPNAPQTFADTEKSRWEERVNTMEEKFKAEANRQYTDADMPPGLADI